MTRTQISTSVSAATRRQAEELMTRHGYSLRDVVTVGIDRLYQESAVAPDAETGQRLSETTEAARQ